MGLGEVLFVVFTVSVALCLQVSTAESDFRTRVEEKVCCEAKWNVSDVQGGCCGAGWGLHCCDRASRLQTCCFGEKRVVLLLHRLQSTFYHGVIWMHALIVVITLIFMTLLLIWTCGAICKYCNRSPTKYGSGYGRSYPVFWSQPTQYGAVLDQSNRGKSGLGLSPPFPGGAHPAHRNSNPYARFDYTPRYYNPNMEPQSYYGHTY